ncbi:MAG: FmdB family zinc ribbon protein [Planctomycetota bacterium]|jgi:putative FmdB family regulatory protein
MPTYEYQCDGCGHEFELFQSITGRVRRKCPECSELRLRRLIGTGGAVIFRGSGFYQTDYRSASYKKAAEAEGKKRDETKADGKKAESAKAESKSADVKKKAK